MTDEKRSAGYFDNVRNCPMYEGDVYYDATLIEPYFRIVHSEEKGFIVHHVGSTETFAICDEGALLIQRQYIGNEKENPDVIKEHKLSLVAGVPIQQSSETVETVEETTQEAPEEATEKECDATPEEKSEPIEEVAETEKSAVEEKIAVVEQANNELKEVNEQLKENVETMFDAPSEKKNEAEPANEEKTEPAETTAASNKEEKPEKAETEEKATNKNVIVEVAKEAVPEIIANTKDEKNAVMRKRFLTNLISKNKDKIADLEVKVAYHTELSQTLDYKPFVKLKEVVTEALHTNVDDENLKGIKERTKDFESILNIQGLLKQHQQKAKEAEFEITDLEYEISKFQDELDELEAKIDTFARQNKLPLESVTE